MNILGTEYKIKIRSDKEDSLLCNCDGYCDTTVKEITIREIDKEFDSVKDLKVFQDNVIRHEMIHAFFHESGLRDYELDETLVEFLAIQLPKLAKISEQITFCNNNRPDLKGDEVNEN